MGSATAILVAVRVAGLPSPRLRGRIEEYWAIERDLRDVGGRFSITPDMYVEIIIWASRVTVVDGARRQRVTPCMFIGLLDRPIVIEANEIVRCAAIRLPAWAKSAVLTRADHSAPWGDASPTFPGLANRVVPLVRARRWPDIWDAFDSALSRPLVVAPRPERGGVGRRQRERRTRAATGMSPLQLANLERFQRARDSLWLHPDKPLGQLASDLGYADQAHFTRHFRRYAGMPPRVFLQELARLRGVANVQDVTAPAK